MNKNITILIFVIIVTTVISSLYFILSKDKSEAPVPTLPDTQDYETPDIAGGQQRIISEPIDNAKSRITKKPFGIYITPATSPIQPERFSGYHTGTDFETTSEEASIDIPIYAICGGKVRSKDTISGYGGVIIQDCTIDGQAVTVLYGHLNIERAVNTGAQVRSGDRISFLADAGSELAGGERKHLHLGILRSKKVDYRGYVQSEAELNGWLDIKNYL